MMDSKADNNGRGRQIGLTESEPLFVAGYRGNQSKVKWTGKKNKQKPKLEESMTVYETVT